MGKRLLLALGVLLGGLVIESRITGKSFTLDLLHPNPKAP